MWKEEFMSIILLLTNLHIYNKRPVQLIFCQPFQDIQQAIAFEKQIKGWTRKKKEALIENNWDRIKELAVCINETSYLNYKQTRTPFDSAQGDKTQ